MKQYSNSHCDPELLKILEEQVLQTAKNLINSDSILDNIRLAISSKLGNTEVNADTIALEMGMSRRTLNRRLKENDTTFNQIKESIILELAKESLSTTSVSIAELAQRLGYSDSSAFNRVFRRLTGNNPLAYRKKHS